MFQVFRLALSTQPVVNFPPLTARLLYEKYTAHIEQDEYLNIYDPSSGWGGRILGAMSSMKRIHYIGTDPNTDNFISELGKTRYEYVADFFNEHGLETNPFWEEPKIPIMSFKKVQNISVNIQTSNNIKVSWILPLHHHLTLIENNIVLMKSNHLGLIQCIMIGEIIS